MFLINLLAKKNYIIVWFYAYKITLSLQIFYILLLNTVDHMVFTTPVFLFLFLPFTLGLYFLMQKRYRNAFLLVMSSAFYFFGEQRMLFLMYGVILLNYCIALFFSYIDNKINSNLITAKRGHLFKKSALIICVCICIGLLWYFKYWHFSIDIFNKTASFLGINYQLSLVDKILLPLGISFYTFHVLSYTFDVYQGKMKADKNLLNFMAYVLMFPQLVAGPIVRYIDIQKQFEHRIITINGFSNGIRRFCFGFAKKVLIANTVAKAADKIFALPVEQIDFATAWLGGGVLRITNLLRFQWLFRHGNRSCCNVRI